MSDDDDLFGGLDLESAKDNPWEVPAGMYDFTLTKVEKVKGKGDNESKNYLVLTFTVDDGEYAGKVVKDQKWIPDRDDESSEAADAASYLKMRLLQLGIPESRVNSVSRDDLVGIEVTAAVVKNGEYTNLSRKKGEFKLRNAPQPQAAGGLDMFK